MGRREPRVTNRTRATNRTPTRVWTTAGVYEAMSGGPAQRPRLYSTLAEKSRSGTPLPRRQLATPRRAAGLPRTHLLEGLLEAVCGAASEAGLDGRPRRAASLLHRPNASSTAGSYRVVFLCRPAPSAHGYPTPHRSQDHRAERFTQRQAMGPSEAHARTTGAGAANTVTDHSPLSSAVEKTNCVCDPPPCP